MMTHCLVFSTDQNIQSGQHDSAEDALIALLLYKRYCELRAEGPETIHANISELYETGRKLAWKVPPNIKLSESPVWPGPDMSDPSMWTGPQDSEDDILDQTPSFFES